MQPFRFVHAAGLRLDSPFLGLHRPSAPVVERVCEATHDAFRNLLRLCRDERVDFLLLAGDAFDADDRGIRAQLRLHDGLAALAGDGVQSFVVQGCADRPAAWLRSLDWPEGVHLFRSGPERVELLRDGKTVAAVHGASSLPGRDQSGAGAGPPEEKPDGLFTIDLRHCDLHGPAIEDASYLALGPGASGPPDEGPPGGPAGPLQSIDAAETGPHGCRVIDVDSAGNVESRFVAVDAVRREGIEVDISGVDSRSALVELLVRRLKEAGTSAGERDLVCKVTLIGRSAADCLRASAAALERLVDDVRVAAGFGRPWVWLDRVVDRTRPIDDAFPPAARDELAEIVATLARDALEDGEPLPAAARSAVDQLRSQYGGELLSGADAAELRGWLREAGRLAVGTAHPGLGERVSDG